MNVERIREVFVGRTDAFGLYQRDNWITIKEELTDKAIQLHLDHDVTIGVYPFYKDNGNWYCKWICIDIDDHEEPESEKIISKLQPVAREVKKLIRQDFNVGFNSTMIEFTGGGFHNWIFLEEHTKLEVAYQFGIALKKTILKNLDIDIEVFPKQDQISENSFGNFVRLPFGYHQQRKYKSRILDKFDVDKIEGYKIDPNFIALAAPAPTKKKVLPATTTTFNFEKMRPPFQDIINGKINIEEYAKKQGKEEFVYWKFLFRELYIYCNIEPQNIYSILKKNQSSFDIKTTESQLKHHDFKSKPLTNAKLKEYFPDYKIKKKKKAKKLTEEEIEQCNEWLELSDQERFDYIQNILEFNILGERQLIQSMLIYFLKLGDYFEILNQVSIMGDPSRGKSYICDNVIKLLPNSCFLLDSASSKYLKYEMKAKDYSTLYLREMKYGMSLIEDLKALWDKDVFHGVVEKDDTGQFIGRLIKQNQIGVLTTFSFDIKQQDYKHRNWLINLYLEEDEILNIIDFRIDKRKNKLDKIKLQNEIDKKIKIVKNSITLLDKNLTVDIPFDKNIKSLFRLFEHQRARAIRDVDKLLDLIEIITIFNQKDRTIEYNEKTKKSIITAQKEDFKMALQIGKNIFFAMVANINEVQRRLLDFMKIGKEAFKDEEGNSRNYYLSDFYKKFGTFLNITAKTISRHLKNLYFDGWINIINFGMKGKTNEYIKLKDYKKLDINIDKILSENGGD